MRLLLFGFVALTCTFGCGRLGFDPVGRPTGNTLDAGAATHALDAEVPEAGVQLDASLPQVSPIDAAVGVVDGGARDASVLDAAVIAKDATTANDGALPTVLDSGASDAATLDAAADGGPIALCPERSDALFCDGFEDPGFSRWGYVVIMNGTLERSTARAHSGVGSLRATTGAASSSANAARYGVRVFGHQKSGEIWARYYYYLPSSTVVNSAFSTGVVAEIEDPYFGFALLALPSRVDIGVFDTFYHGTTVFPRDHWTCVELHVVIDATAGIFEAYLDGTLAAHTSTPTNTLPTKGYTSLDVGIHYTDSAQGPVEVFVDDVLAATTRLGCN